jgi:hypothetical protein
VRKRLRHSGVTCDNTGSKPDEKVMWKDGVNREKCILVVSAA